MEANFESVDSMINRLGSSGAVEKLKAVKESISLLAAANGALDFRNAKAAIYHLALALLAARADPDSPATRQLEDVLSSFKLVDESGLYAQIRADSKYCGQADGPFPVDLYSDGEYVVHGDPGRYRLVDVDLFWANNAGTLFPCRKA